MFTGRVAYADINAYYSLIDAFVVPRHDVGVARLVTPLKPYEAMAMERVVVMSRLEALMGMIIEGETGVSFTPGDARDLADVLEPLLVDPERRDAIGRAAGAWVREHRSWRRQRRAVPGAVPATGGARERTVRRPPGAGRGRACRWAPGPNFIKAAPVIRALGALGVRQRIVHTGQHYDPLLSDVFFRDLSLPSPDVSLGVGSGSQGHQTGALLAALEDEFVAHRPAWSSSMAT